jgi:AcrR family transcriptional regulator
MTFSETAHEAAGGSGPAWRVPPWQDRALERSLADARARDVERMERLVDAARQLANESGSAAFTVAQVAERAGLSLKGFYRCFESKDALLLALLEDDSRLGAEILSARIGDLTGPDAIRAYVTELFDMLMVPGAAGYAGVLVREHRRLAERYDAEQRTALSPLVDLLARHLAGDDHRRDAETMFSVLIEGIHQVVIGRVADAHELGEYLHRFCTRGVEG